MTIFDPEATWKRKEVYHFEARELLVPIFKNGELVYKAAFARGDPRLLRRAGRHAMGRGQAL